MIAISIVSHGHGAMLEHLVAQLQSCPEVGRIILTCNIPESGTWAFGERLEVINNPAPKGFGANHNAAFARCREDYFCVLNPDIELQGNPFTALLAVLKLNEGALVAPLIVAPDGRVEDSVRYFPTGRSLVRKVLGGHDGRYPLQKGQKPFSPEWVAGMFMLFRSDSFVRLGGFDEGYFLYYEDVDICVRVWKAGMKVIVCPSVSAIHDARRDSHRSLRHLRWHLSSVLRYFLLHMGRLPTVR